MTLWNSLRHLQHGGGLAGRGIWPRPLWPAQLSCVTVEFLGYWLQVLLDSGWIGFLSRNHMKHHLLGPLDRQRRQKHRDATEESLSFANSAIEWLLPAALLIVPALLVCHVFYIPWIYQLLFLGATLAWSLLMFSSLHDAMHIEGVWRERSRWLKHWFKSVRTQHDMHHCVINDRGLMNRNFGIGFFLFARLFGTFSAEDDSFNRAGYEEACRRFQSAFDAEERLAAAD